MGTLNLAAPLVLFKKSRLWAGTRFHLLPFFHHHPTQHNYITQTVTHTVILTSTFSSTHYTDTRPTRNVVCPSGVWIENKPHSTSSICLARNPKHVIVQWVGIGTNIHTLFASLLDADRWWTACELAVKVGIMSQNWALHSARHSGLLQTCSTLDIPWNFQGTTVQLHRPRWTGTKGNVMTFLDKSSLWTKPRLAHMNQTWNANQMNRSIPVPK